MAELFGHERPKVYQKAMRFGLFGEIRANDWGERLGKQRDAPLIVRPNRSP